MCALCFVNAEDDLALCLTICPIVHHSISNGSRAAPCRPDPVAIAGVCSLVSIETRVHYLFYL